MSLTERERACVVRQVALGQIGQKVAAERLGIGVRQMKRLMRLWRTRGDSGLVSHKAETAFEPDAATSVIVSPIASAGGNSFRASAVCHAVFHPIALAVSTLALAIQARICNCKSFSTDE